MQTHANTRKIRKHVTYLYTKEGLIEATIFQATKWAWWDSATLIFTNVSIKLLTYVNNQHWKTITESPGKELKVRTLATTWAWLYAKGMWRVSILQAEHTSHAKWHFFHEVVTKHQRILFLHVEPKLFNLLSKRNQASPLEGVGAPRQTWRLCRLCPVRQGFRDQAPHACWCLQNALPYVWTCTAGTQSWQSILRWPSTAQDPQCQTFGPGSKRKLSGRENFGGVLRSVWHQAHCPEATNEDGPCKHYFRWQRWHRLAQCSCRSSRVAEHFDGMNLFGANLACFAILKIQRKAAK